MEIINISGPERTLYQYQLSRGYLNPDRQKTLILGNNFSSLFRYLNTKVPKNENSKGIYYLICQKLAKIKDGARVLHA